MMAAYTTVRGNKLHLFGCPFLVNCQTRRVREIAKCIGVARFPRELHRAVGWPCDDPFFTRLRSQVKGNTRQRPRHGLESGSEVSSVGGDRIGAVATTAQYDI